MEQETALQLLETLDGVIYAGFFIVGALSGSAFIRGLTS
tara:strand:+ start:555 stop:671 length:117 start_codon:yes stop_codon:yes gene_type:complete